MMKCIVGIQEGNRGGLKGAKINISGGKAVPISRNNPTNGKVIRNDSPNPMGTKVWGINVQFSPGSSSFPWWSVVEGGHSKTARIPTSKTKNTMKNFFITLILVQYIEVVNTNVENVNTI